MNYIRDLVALTHLMLSHFDGKANRERVLHQDVDTAKSEEQEGGSNSRTARVLWILRIS